MYRRVNTRDLNHFLDRNDFKGLKEREAEDHCMGEIHGGGQDEFSHRGH